MSETTASHDPAADPVHGSGWNSAARWGGWSWREPRDGEWFRTCSFCGCIHPEDLAPELVAEGPCAVCGETGWDACFRARQPAWYPAAKARGELHKVPSEELDRFDAMPAPHPYDPGGAYASWADRKYGFPHKFYVEQLRNREPDRLHVVSARSSRSHDDDGRGWINVSEIPDGTVVWGWSNLDESYDQVQLQARPTLFAKFYTVHLKDPAIGQDVKDAVQRASGLRFTWHDDGRIAWEPA